MLLNGTAMTTGSVLMDSRAFKPVTSHQVFGCSHHLPAKTASLRIRSSWRLPQVLKSWSCRGMPPHSCFSASSTSLLALTMPVTTRRPRYSTLVRASKDVPYKGFRYPPMMKKPQWWWRTLSCLPYLMPLHETWMYAETAYNLHPFLANLEYLTMPFLKFIGKLPSWSLMAYFFVAYLGIVRRKEWPHFFRFHVVVGMLLEISLQVIGTISRWLPSALYWGKLGMHFWTVLSFGFLFTVLECIRCSLRGMYADVPFVSDAAYIQIPYD